MAISFLFCGRQEQCCKKTVLNKNNKNLSFSHLLYHKFVRQFGMNVRDVKVKSGEDASCFLKCSKCHSIFYQIHGMQDTYLPKRKKN